MFVYCSLARLFTVWGLVRFLFGGLFVYCFGVGLFTVLGVLEELGCVRRTGGTVRTSSEHHHFAGHSGS